MANKRGPDRKGPEFWSEAVKRINAGENVTALAQELGVSAPLVSVACATGAAGKRPAAAAGSQAGTGEPTAEADAGGEGAGGGFFARCLAQSRGTTPEQRQQWRSGIYDQVREVMPVQGSLSVERMWRLTQVSRAGYYRSFQEHCPVEEEMLVRSAIQQIVVEHRRHYGYRRVVLELDKRGLVVNHKRVLRLMREDNLLALQPKRFVVTTESNHSLEIAVNLARRMKLRAVNQLWVADITYIQVWREFVFLAVVLDAYSRKVVGWELSRSLGSGLAVKALEKAIAERQPAPGLVHHSDRGVQYASREYVALLEQHQMIATY